MQGKVTTEETASVYVGVDVCKDHLDVCLHPLGERFRVGNDRDGRRALVRRLGRHKVALVAMEPTSKYHRSAHRQLATAGFAVALVNPLRARLFAEACGRLAKTDAIDAAMLALMAERLAPAPTAPPTLAEEQLEELASARSSAIAERVALDNRRSMASAPFLRRELAARLRSLDRHIARLEREIDIAIAADPATARRAEILRSIPGVGPVTTIAFLAWMREIGQLNAKQAAALAGLAPVAHDSGPARGKRRIRGGRGALRTTLYMAALVASQRNPDLKRFYQQLKSRGKPPKLALTAVARKLVILANRLVSENRTWMPLAS